MIYKMFTIRDSKAEIYSPPFYKKTHGEAERDFRELTRDPKSMVSKYPMDFDLFHVGEFDDSTGKIDSLVTPKHIMKALDASPESNA